MRSQIISQCSIEILYWGNCLSTIGNLWMAFMFIFTPWFQFAWLHFFGWQRVCGCKWDALCLPWELLHLSLCPSHHLSPLSASPPSHVAQSSLGPPGIGHLPREPSSVLQFNCQSVGVSVERCVVCGSKHWVSCYRITQNIIWISHLSEKGPTTRLLRQSDHIFVLNP